MGHTWTPKVCKRSGARLRTGQVSERFQSKVPESFWSEVPERFWSGSGAAPEREVPERCFLTHSRAILERQRFWSEVPDRFRRDSEARISEVPDTFCRGLGARFPNEVVERFWTRFRRGSAAAGSGARFRTGFGARLQSVPDQFRNEVLEKFWSVPGQGCGREVGTRLSESFVGEVPEQGS